MKILVVGSGGREHALAWKLAQSERIQMVYVAPGNGGTARDIRLLNVDITDIHQRADFVVAENIEIAGLRRFKDDVTEVRDGFECGINLGSFNDLQLDDLIATYEMREKPRA